MPEDRDVKKVIEEKPLSIDEICSSTWEPVYRFIYYKVQNREEAEDITQETYVKAIDYFQRDKVTTDKYIGFLKTIALNILRDLWRKNKRQGQKVNVEAINPLEIAINDHAQASNNRMLIEDALSRLKFEQRKVIELRILKGYSVADTAEVMGKKESTIRVTQFRALKNLSDILKSVEEDITHGVK